LEQNPGSVGVAHIIRQFVFGAVVSGCNIAIHAAAMAVVIGGTRKAAAINVSHPTLRLIAVMIAAVLTLMIAHLVEVLVWASSYAMLGVAPEGADRIYFAFVNYTTLGYGDITPLERWRLLGPMTAMNGVLLFGWSTAVIFEVLQKVLELAEIRKRSRA
jgi:ion channel